ncbi:MAG: hypothetical protein COA41_11140 [Sphingopyxis sp.]|nr:MAG: hypothetical protein COA41_11140 [Sphingopyxis sp.]
MAFMEDQERALKRKLIQLDREYQARAAPIIEQLALIYQLRGPGPIIVNSPVSGEVVHWPPLVKPEDPGHDPNTD